MEDKGLADHGQVNLITLMRDLCESWERNTDLVFDRGGIGRERIVLSGVESGKFLDVLEIIWPHIPGFPVDKIRGDIN